MDRDVMDLARAISREARLLEVGREAGRRFYRWTETDLLVAIGRRDVHLSRGRTHVGIDRERLPALTLALDRWVAMRERWAAFFARGLPPVGALSRYYLPPYVDDAIEVGGRGAAGAFVGRDELRPWAPVALCRGVTRVGERWRVEERVGPPEGSAIGERWVIGDGLVLDAGRRQVVLSDDPDFEGLRLRPPDRPALRAIRARTGPGRGAKRRDAR